MMATLNGFNTINSRPSPSTPFKQQTLPMPLSQPPRLVPIMQMHFHYMLIGLLPVRRMSSEWAAHHPHNNSPTNFQKTCQNQPSACCSDSNSVETNRLRVDLFVAQYSNVFYQTLRFLIKSIRNRIAAISPIGRKWLDKRASGTTNILVLMRRV